MNPVSAPVEQTTAPRLSGFNKSFKNLLSAKVGTLVPILCDPVIAGTRVDLRTALLMNMPPLASDTYADLRLKVEAFFVPASACYGGFNAAVTRRKLAASSNSNLASNYVDVALPGVPINTLLDDTFIGAFSQGSLADYLGMKEITMFPSTGNYSSPLLNPLPFIAYHRIYDRFYRNSLVEKPIFNMVPSGLSQGRNASCLPYVAFAATDQNYIAQISSEPSLNGWTPYLMTPDSDADSAMSIFSLRQRNYGADYFTNAKPSVQKGDPSAVSFTVNTDTGAGEFTIQALRAANALQIFRERNNLCDDNIHSYNRIHYGVTRTNYGESLPQYLGSGSINVSTDPITQNANDNTDSVSTQNPFTSVGTQYGRATANGMLDLIHGFEAPEYGFIMVLASLVPVPAYSSGIRRYLMECTGVDGYADIPDPVLQGVGPQEVYGYELAANDVANVTSSNPTAFRERVFGYQQRYAHYMDIPNEVHGLFRSGNSLSSFALQRKFTAPPTINTSFLKIDRTALDGISAVEYAVSDFGYWLDCYHDYKVVMPLSAYLMPTLANPEGSTEFVHRPGLNF